MELEFRETQWTDIESRFDVRTATRQNALLARLGITLQSSVAVTDLASGAIRAWECVHDCRVVGHCTGNSATGEILGLAVLPSYEGRGIGRRLLSLVVGGLRAAGAKRIWLATPSDPALRAYGFYRALGWRPTGEQTGNGDEILEPSTDNAC
jgi:ribosomal protein S18 acetylase RimI-like enzyme